MERLLELAFEFRFIIALVVAVIVFALFETEKFKAKATSLMLTAKSLAKDAVLNSGQEQEDWVVTKLYVILPRTITLFISEDMMRTLVRKLYATAKDYIDDGVINHSI